MTARTNARPHLAPQDDEAQRGTRTIDEGARVLGISPSLLRGLIREGYIPALRLGRRVLIRTSTLERLLAEPQGEDARITQLVQTRQELIREQTRPRTHAHR